MLPIQTFLILWTGFFWPPARTVDPCVLVDKPIAVSIDRDGQGTGATVKVVAQVEDDKIAKPNCQKGCQGCTLKVERGKPGACRQETACSVVDEKTKRVMIKVLADGEGCCPKPKRGDAQSTVLSKVIKLGKADVAAAGGDSPGECRVMMVRPDAKSGCISIGGPDKNSCRGIAQAIKLHSARADGGEDDQHVRQMIINLRGGDDENDVIAEAMSSAIAGCSDEDDPPMLLGAVFAGNEDEPPQKHMLKLEGPCVTVIESDDTGGAGVEVGGPWLGITYGPVPKPLAIHLKLEAGTGQMVLNVVEGSPADQAGLAQYDVVLKMDGQELTGDVGKLLGQVRELKPGQDCTLTLIRAGEKTKVDVTVGKRPEASGPPKYKYESDVEEQSLGRVFRHGGLLEKNPAGNWMFKRFDVEGLPDVFNWLPEDEDLAFNVGPLGPMPHSDMRTFLYKEGKGLSLRISREQDGTIEVTRTETGKDGEEKKTVKEYADEEELEKGDPEAYDLLKKCPEGGIGVGVGDINTKVIITPRGQGPKIAPPEEVRVYVEEARKQAEGARKQAAEARKQAAELGVQTGRLSKEAQKANADFFSAGKPRTSFELRANGEIRVAQRHGEDELVEVFKNADELKSQRPELYQKFKKLHYRGEDQGSD